MDRKIYREFRGALNELDTGELRTLEHELIDSDSFRREAGAEFSKAVHDARDKQLFA